MADSIPSLRRKLDEALAENERLRSELAVKPKPVERIVYVDRPVNVPGPERIRYVYPEVVKVEYHDNPEHLRMIAELQGRLQAWQAISQSDS